MRKNIIIGCRRILKGIFHPFKALQYCMYTIDQTLKISEYAKAFERGERLVLRTSWGTAKSSRNFTTLAHIQRYEWIISELKLHKVETLLDLGCGSGYGTAKLAESLEIPFVIGVDISKNAISYAMRHWNRDTLWFKRMDGTKLHFPLHFFDVIISFDVLAHLEKEQQDALLQNIVKVLKPRGMCYLGCPNGKVSRGNNPHHKHELSSEEFLNLCRRYFNSVKLLCQDIMINGERKQEYWHNFIGSLDWSNLGIFEDDCENAFGLLCICNNPRKYYA